MNIDLVCFVVQTGIWSHFRHVDDLGWAVTWLWQPCLCRGSHTLRQRVNPFLGLQHNFQVRSLQEIAESRKNSGAWKHHFTLVNFTSCFGSQPSNTSRLVNFVILLPLHLVLAVGSLDWLLSESIRFKPVLGGSLLLWGTFGSSSKN